LNQRIFFSLKRVDWCEFGLVVQPYAADARRAAVLSWLLRSLSLSVTSTRGATSSAVCGKLLAARVSTALRY